MVCLDVRVLAMVFLGFLLATLTVAASLPPSPYMGFSQVVKREDATANFTDQSLTVDLGYGVYQGWTNTSASLNIWQGYVWCYGHQLELRP